MHIFQLNSDQTEDLPWLWTVVIVDDVLLSNEGKGHTDFIWESSEFGDMYM